MPPRSSAYRNRWGSDLTREPLNVYADKETQRAGQLVEKASQAKYGTPKPPSPIARVQAAINGQTAAVRRAAGPPPIPGAKPMNASLPAIPTKKSGGFLSKVGGVLDAVTPDAVGSAARTVGKDALVGAEALHKYVGKPVFGLSMEPRGVLGAPIDAITKRDMTQIDPRNLYKRGNRNYDTTRSALDAVPVVGKALSTGLDIATDPLTYVGPGAVKGALHFAPEAVRLSKGARFAGTILENPRNATIGATVGSGAGAQVGYDVGGDKGQAIGALAGGLVGGVAGAHPRATGAALVRGSDRITGALDKAGIVPKGTVPGAAMINVEHPFSDVYMETLAKHGIEFQIDGTGTLAVDEAHAQQVINDLYTKHSDVLMARRDKGIHPVDAQTGAHFEGDGQVRLPNGTVVERKAKSSNPAARSKAEKDAEKEAQRVSLADHSPQVAQDIQDAQRISEVLDAKVHDTQTLETHRLAWDGPMEPVPPKTPKKIADTPLARTRVDGRVRADDFARTKMVPGFSPSSTELALRAEADNIRVVQQYSKTPADTAYADRLDEIANSLRDKGAAAAQNVGNAAKEVPAGPGVRGVEATGPRDPGASGGAPAGSPGVEPTVKRVDLQGRVTDTGQTETKLNGWVDPANRATQGGLEDAAKLAAMNDAAAPSVRRAIRNLPDNPADAIVAPVTGPQHDVRAQLAGSGAVPAPEAGRISEPMLGGGPGRSAGTVPAADRAGVPTQEGRIAQRRADGSYETLPASRLPASDLIGAPNETRISQATTEGGSVTGRGDQHIPAGERAGAAGFEGTTPPPSLPPTGPADGTPPREPGPGNPQRGFGQTDQPEDILGTKSRDALLAKEKAAIDASKTGGRLKARALAKAPIKIIRDALQGTNRTIDDWVNETVDQLRFDANRAGLNLEHADTHWDVVGADGSRAPMRDVVEGSTDAGKAVRAQLTPAQTEIITRGQRLLERAVKTAEGQGVTVPLLDTVTGEFWPSRVSAVDVNGSRIDRTTGSGSGSRGRTLGAAREGTRTQASEAIGSQARDLVYADPFEALKDSLRGKLRMAQDGYVASLIEPLATPSAKSGFGYRSLKTSHPALDKVRFVGQADSGAAMLGTARPVFENGVANQLDNILNNTSIANTKPGRVVSAINSVLTPVRASQDLSAFLNTGLGFIESSPQNMVKAVKGQIDVVRSTLGNPEQYATLRRTEISRSRDLLRQAGIEGGQADDWLVRHGKHYAGERSAEEFLYPEGFKGALATKGGNVPVVGGAIHKVGAGIAKSLDWSDENFARYLNYARDVMANDALERAVKQGLTGPELETEMETALKAVNRVTGWTATSPTGIERIGMFAPRFFRANIEQIAAAATKGGLEGSVARAHLIKLMTIAGVATYGMNAVRGYDTDIDPRSHNFMKVRDVAGRDVSLLGPFATIIRAASQTVAGQPGTMSSGPRGRGVTFGTNTPKPDPAAAVDFGRTKFSPVVGTLWDIMVAKADFSGRPIEANPTKPGFYTSTIPNIAQENIPFAAQGAIQEGIAPAIRSGDPQKLLTGAGAAVVSGFGLNSAPTTPAERRDLARDTVAKEFFKTGYGQLTGDQKSKVNEDKRIRDQEAEIQRRGLARDDQRAKIEDDYRTKVTSAGTYLAKGTAPDGRLRYTGIDYRKALDAAGTDRAAAMKTVGQPVGSSLDGWFSLRDKAVMADGQVDYTKLEGLQADYQTAHPTIQDDLAKFVGAKDDATQRELRAGRTQAAEFYQIPPVRGMSRDEGERANAILAEARIMTTADQASSTKHALSILIKAGRITSEESQMALRAQKLGSNPERSAYRNAPEHAAFRQFYVGVDTSLGTAGAFPGASSGAKKASLPKLNLGGSGSTRSTGASSRRASASARRSG